MNNQIYLITTQLSKIFFPNVKNRGYYIGGYLSLVNNLIKREGTLSTSKILKKYKLYFTRYLCGSPLFDKEFPLTAKGIPTTLSFLEGLLDVDNEHTRFLLTLFNVNRCIKPKKKEVIPYSLDSITAPFNGRTSELNSKILRRVMINMGLKPIKLKEFEQSDLLMISKAGPHGPSTLTSLKTMFFFPDELVRHLCEFTCLKGVIFINHLRSIIGPTPPVRIRKDRTEDAVPITRRLSVIKDPECKMRVIAIFD